MDRVGASRDDGSGISRPTSIYTAGFRQNEFNLDDIPPPVPEKDEGYTPSTKSRPTTSASSASRPMTRSTNKLSFDSIARANRRKIKYGKGKYAHVELVPQPSDDPDDPLNWPRWRKELNLVSLLGMVALIGGMKTVFISTNGVMATDFGVSYTSVAALTAVPLIISTFTGMASLVAGKVWGKRPMYLTSFVFIFIGSVWNMASGGSYGSTMGARVFQGLGWGAFDTLVLGSIQDTFFEHERNLRVSIYNVFTIATTWGSPLIGGIASQNAGGFTVQFRIINSLYFLAIPLLVFGAPETVFDRSRTSVVQTSAIYTAREQQRRQKPRAWRLRNRLTKEAVLEYVKKTDFWSFQGFVSKRVLLQAPRALVAPTTGLVFLLSFIPYCFLWGLANTVAMVATPMPLMLPPSTIGTLMTGPWAFATLIVAVFCFWRQFQERFTPAINLATIASGTLLVVVGVLAFGLIVYRAMTRGIEGTPDVVNMDAADELSLPLLSFLLGMLAAGVYVLDATTRPLIARSASFTSSNMTTGQRCTGDMHAGVVVLRNLFAGIFIMWIPDALSGWDGLRATVIGLSVGQIGLAGGIAALWWFYDESIWRADGKVMGLVDLSILKRSASFFDAD